MAVATIIAMASVAEMVSAAGMVNVVQVGAASEVRAARAAVDAEVIINATKETRKQVFESNLCFRLRFLAFVSRLP